MRSLVADTTTRTLTREPGRTRLRGVRHDEPAGWVAVEPRTACTKLRTSRVLGSGRDEDKDDDRVCAVTCFVIRNSHRGRGLTHPFARATIDVARERGATAR